MGYCTVSDVQTRISEHDLVRLSDHDGDGSVDTDVVNSAIDDASSHIDSYVQKVYKVPVSPTPDALKKRAVILTIYFLQLYRDSVTESMAQAKKDVDRWLEMVAKGEVDLGAATKPTESSSAGGVDWDAEDRVFGRDSGGVC